MITLEGLLKVIVSQKIITVNLYDENDLLLISFGLPGYDCLDDFLLDDEVTKLEITNLYNINITIDTSTDE
jgi:hypothetical protein